MNIIKFLDYEEKEKLDKSGWYRIPERENESFRADKSFVGKFVCSNRVIVRAGYFLEPKDCPPTLAKKEVRDRILNSFDWLDKKKWFDLVEYLDVFESKLIKQLLYRYRGEWHQEKLRDVPKEDRVRTFWYLDLPEWQKFYVHSIQTKKIGDGGQYLDPGYDSPYGYSPPESYSWFTIWSSHQLYRVESWTIGSKYSPGDCYLHPEDIVLNP